MDEEEEDQGQCFFHAGSGALIYKQKTWLTNSGEQYLYLYLAVCPAERAGVIVTSEPVLRLMLYPELSIMQNTVKILNKEEPVDLYNATVIHANKYYQTSGGWGSWPVISTLYIDVVFRDKASGDDWPITVRNLDLPLYNEQEVSVICVRNIIIGYVDRKANRYYFTTSDFAKTFTLGIRRVFMWLTGIAGGLITYLLVPHELAFWAFLPLLLAVLVFYIQKMVINYRVGAELDHYMSGK